MASLESVPSGWGAGTDLEQVGRVLCARSQMTPGILCSIPKSDVSLIRECSRLYLLLQTLHGAAGRGLVMELHDLSRPHNQ